MIRVSSPVQRKLSRSTEAVLSGSSWNKTQTQKHNLTAFSVVKSILNKALNLTMINIQPFHGLIVLRTCKSVHGNGALITIITNHITWKDSHWSVWRCLHNYFSFHSCGAIIAFVINNLQTKSSTIFCSTNCFIWTDLTSAFFYRLTVAIWSCTKFSCYLNFSPIK